LYLAQLPHTTRQTPSAEVLILAADMLSTSLSQHTWTARTRDGRCPPNAHCSPRAVTAETQQTHRAKPARGGVRTGLTQHPHAPRPRGGARMWATGAAPEEWRSPMHGDEASGSDQRLCEHRAAARRSRSSLARPPVARRRAHRVRRAARLGAQGGGQLPACFLQYSTVPDAYLTVSGLGDAESCSSFCSKPGFLPASSAKDPSLDKLYKPATA